jgi:hypothetical protein
VRGWEMMKKSFTVSVEMPEGVTVLDMQRYIREAVQYWKGGLHPDDPLFELDYRKVFVRPVKEERK